jgi:Protein of unknown function (DUF3108)
MVPIASKCPPRGRARLIAIALIGALILALPCTGREVRAAGGDSARAKAAGAKHKRKHPAEPPKPLPLPDDVKVPVYRPGALTFHDGERLIYRVSWLEIPAATARIEFHRNRKDPKLWNAEAWVDTTKVVDVLFKMRDYLRERFSTTTLQPRDMYIRQSENRRLNDFDVTFDRASRLVKLVKHNQHGTATREFIADNPWGPLSGAMMALSQPLQPGERLVFDVFTGSNRYVFDFHVDGRERVRVPVGDFDALKITPGVVYMSDGKLRSQARETEVWVTADQRHLPLRIQAAAFIGTVRADLVEIDGGPPAAGAAPAAAR